jgi:glycerol-3-phosphate acyltransferase PlsY
MQYSITFYEILATGFFAYILGSIPFSLILPQIFCNVDVRKIGSGNVGATNVYRACGIKMAVICFLLDGLKGCICVLFASFVLKLQHADLYIFAICAILGHVYSCFLKFKGGKGVATSVFVIFVLDPLFALIFGICWGLVFYAKKISSLSAIVSFFVLAICSVIFSNFVGIYAKYFYIFLFLFICLTHRKNIKKLINKTEGKIKHENQK